jgi:hypothetical protein
MTEHRCDCEVCAASGRAERRGEVVGEVIVADVGMLGVAL